MEILAQRKRSRINRTPGQAQLLFPFIHSYVVYDFKVDTSILKP